MCLVGPTAESASGGKESNVAEGPGWGEGERDEGLEWKMLLKPSLNQRRNDDGCGPGADILREYTDVSAG